MKQTLLLCACLIVSILSFAQINSVDDPDHIKITLRADSIHINFKDKSFKLNTIQDLDSWLKQNIAGMIPPDIDLVSYFELTPQKHRSIIVIMDKYRCPVVSEKTVSDGKPKIAASIRQASF